MGKIDAFRELKGRQGGSRAALQVTGMSMMGAGEVAEDSLWGLHGQ